MGILDGLFGGGHNSIVGALGAKGQKWTDPLAWLPGGLGSKWVDLTSNKIPGMVNSVGSKVMTPFDRIDETINPARRIPIVDRVGDAVRNRPGDAAAIAAGGYFAAPAAMGAVGGSTATGGAAGGGITAAPGFSLGSGGSALGSAAGMTGSWGALSGGGLGASTAIGDVSGMSGSWQPVQNGGTDWLSMVRQATSNMQQQQRRPAQSDEAIQQVEEENRLRRMAEALRLSQFNAQNNWVG